MNRPQVRHGVTACFEVQGLTVEGDWQQIIGTTDKAKCLAISDRLYGHPKYLRLRVGESQFDPENNRHIRRVISPRDHSIRMFFGPVFRAAIHSAWPEPGSIWQGLLGTFRRFVRGIIVADHVEIAKAQPLPPPHPATPERLIMSKININTAYSVSGI